MKAPFQPWQLLLLLPAGLINRRQQDAIEYLLTQIGSSDRSSGRAESRSATTSGVAAPSKARSRGARCSSSCSFRSSRTRGVAAAGAAHSE